VATHLEAETVAAVLNGQYLVSCPKGRTYIEDAWEHDADVA